ncbi:NADH dehydrogenase [ubiquinone] 1 beta subcomplex subunit 10 [Antennarius striatus]|uniref:NADH dehydrogenase [ubiquinone] 1 beta subcomplex subunit 10 n=1 Tax=Antennarius striatus TaxID=241820 RepID=UPI0035B0B16A
MRKTEALPSRSNFVSGVKEDKMPSDHNKDAYPEPPSRTPVVNRQSALPNPTSIMSQLFYYSVDLPVTTFRGVLDSLRSKNKTVYYHQKFRRVPDLTECFEGDYMCHFEAEMQWRRDFKVDREIVHVLQERVAACRQREGHNYDQNCIKEMQQFIEVSKNFQLRYGDLGAYGDARKCLMKQKERMMAAQAQAAQ